MAKIYLESNTGNWRAQKVIKGVGVSRSFRDKKDAQRCLDWMDDIARQVRRGEVSVYDIKGKLEEVWPKRPKLKEHDGAFKRQYPKAKILLHKLSNQWMAHGKIGGVQISRRFRDSEIAQRCQDYLYDLQTQYRENRIDAQTAKALFSNAWPKRKPVRKGLIKSELQTARPTKHSPETTVGTLVAAITMPDRVRIRFASKNAKLLKIKANHIDRKQIEKMRRLVVHDHNWEFQPVWAGLVKQLEAR